MVLKERQDGVLVLTLNRPEKLNAIIDLKTPLAINYTNITPAGINVRFNGVLGTLRFVDATRTLTVNIPDLDYTKTFTGFDRFESIQLFWDELATTDLLERINRQQAASSPTSPITGVGGLIPTIVSQEFNQNFTDSATSIAAPKATSRHAPRSTACHIAPAADPLKNGRASTKPNKTTAKMRRTNRTMSRRCRILRLRSSASRRKSIAAQCTIRYRRRFNK